MYYIPALITNGLFDANRLFLFAVGYNFAPTLVTIFAIPCHFVLCWVFIFILDTGIFGCCYAMVITNGFLMLVLHFYSK